MKYPNLISAEIVADSKAPTGERITTYKLVMPRYILAEFNTHRLFSRNSASSRAIPLRKMIEQVEKTPFIPMAWQKDHKGMQGIEYITNQNHIDAYVDHWLVARDNAVNSALILNTGFLSSQEEERENKVTKQLCNRLLEPFLYHTVLVTATEWDNFFELRCPRYEFPFTWEEETYTYKSKKDIHKKLIEKNKEDKGIGTHIDYDADYWLQLNKGQGEIHIMDLAEKMWDAMNESTPKELKEGEWHIPFGDNIFRQSKQENGGTLTVQTFPQLYPEDWLYMAKIATARCARISYETLGDNPKIDYEADIKLHDMLLKSGHMSPMEHVAKVMSQEDYLNHSKTTQLKGNWEGTGIRNYKDKNRNIIYLNEVTVPEEDLGWSRNFKGFIQYRELVEQL